MKYILVDPKEKKITEVEADLDKGDASLAKIYELIGCETIAVYSLHRRDHCFYCDDEALFKKPLPAACFLDGYHDPIRGRLLIFKTDGYGYEVSPTLTIEDVISMVFWIP